MADNSFALFKGVRSFYLYSQRHRRIVTHITSHLVESTFQRDGVRFGRLTNEGTTHQGSLEFGPMRRLAIFGHPTELADREV